MGRASELLTLLPKRGPKAFGIFIEALVKYDREDLAELLDEDLTANLVEKKEKEQKEKKKQKKEKSPVTQETRLTVDLQETKGMILKQITFCF